MKRNRSVLSVFSAPNDSVVSALCVALVAFGCVLVSGISGQQRQGTGTPTRLIARQDAQAGTITVRRAGTRQPLLIQNAKADRRPSIHGLVVAGSAGALDDTELFWGLGRLNGRDFSQNPTAGQWRRVSATVLDAAGDQVRWQLVYDLMDSSGQTMLTHTERWSMRERNGALVLDLEWRGEAKTDVTLAKDDYAGLVARTTTKGAGAEVVNAARQRNERADRQRAMWIDVAAPIGARSDSVHLAIFDHPDNTGYPQAWRVDAQSGVGSLRSRTTDWTIAKGQTEIVRHRVLVYTGTLSDVEMNTAWAEFTGNPAMSTAALWGIAQREGREETFLTPEQAAAQMTLVNGFAVNVFAAEPAIAQPMAFCWDDRGRLWVAENRDYESRVAGFSNAGTSRILILEDTNQDGVAETRKVFMEGIVFPAAIAVGFDGVFVGAPPNLLFVPDRDGDDKADVDAIEVRLTGWGIEDRHETLNSLHWGPDGWLYGLQGYATSSKIRKPVGNGRVYKHRDEFPEDVLAGEGVEINGGVWRYHPTKDIFEVVAHGFSNPWGIDYDAKGQLLISACVIPHLWHVIPGGIYHRQGGQHFNPYVYNDIQTIADHRHRSAHGGARVYQSDAFPPSQQGRVFMANIHEHAVLSDVLVRKGSGFTAHHGEDFLLANNAQWIGFSVEIGPDGALYVLDWHDGDICGMDVLHYETGRIFRVAPTQSRAERWEGRYSDLRRMSDVQLVELQTKASDWHARRARVILQHRASRGTLNREAVERLRNLFRSTANPDWRLRAMWTLHVTGGWTSDALVQVLGDADEYVRAWAVQLLCEDRSPSSIALEKFAQMARDDPSPVVRLYLASALQRLDRGARWAIASALMMRGEDAADHNLPRMLWLGVEPLVAENASVALDHASRSAIPLVARSIARRSVDARALDPLVAAIGRKPKTLVDLLEGMRDGLEGQIEVEAPPNWASVRDALKTVREPAARLLRDVAQQFGDIETARHNLSLVRSRTAAVEERRSALRVLAAQRRPELVEELPSALDDEGLRVEAIRAIAGFDEESLAELLIARYATFTAPEKMEAVQTLATRSSYGTMLAEAIAADRVPRRDIPPHVARQLFRVVGAGFTDVWGPMEQSVAHEKTYARYRRLLNQGAMRSANLQNGRTLFQRTCGTCHKLYGEGGAIGPDLTGSNRSNVDYLLFNVLDPNGEVPDAYKMVVVTTRDGRTFSGNIAAETDTQLTLRVVGRDPVVIAKSTIQTREVTAASLMPPGLFEAMSDREVIDLVAYLRTVTPVRAGGSSGGKP